MIPAKSAASADLARNMELAVVAEGVEDEAALEQLHTLGCDLVPGYFLSRPLGPDRDTAWINSHALPRGKEPGGLRRWV
jgi:EAL domain-containing protein (putative c-di-GMP-specific phosphodiesterase class I)